MSLIRFLIILAIGTLMSWASWVLVVLTLDPTTGSGLAVVLFYSSLWLGLIGLLTAAGFFFRYWFEKKSKVYRQISVALRQSVIVSSGSVLALILQAGGVLSWWTGLLLILIIITVEVFYLAGETRTQPTT